MDELNYETMSLEELQRRGYGDLDDEQARHEYQKRARLLKAQAILERESK